MIFEHYIHKFVRFHACFSAFWNLTGMAITKPNRSDHFCRPLVWRGHVPPVPPTVCIRPWSVSVCWSVYLLADYWSCGWISITWFFEGKDFGKGNNWLNFEADVMYSGYSLTISMTFTFRRICLHGGETRVFPFRRFPFCRLPLRHFLFCHFPLPRGRIRVRVRG